MGPSPLWYDQKKIQMLFEKGRTKLSLDSPQTIEANKKLTSSVLGQIVFGIFDNSLKFSPLRNMCQKFGHN